MKQRLNYAGLAPEGFAAMLGLEKYVRDSGLGHALLELVKTRVSHLNRCAFCLDMPTDDARAAGESERKACASRGPAVGRGSYFRQNIARPGRFYRYNESA